MINQEEDSEGEGARQPKLKPTVTTKAPQSFITETAAYEVKVVPSAACNESHE